MFSVFLCVPLVLGFPVPQAPVGPQGWGHVRGAGLRSVRGLSGWFAPRPRVRVTACAHASWNVKTRATINTQNVPIKNSGPSLGPPTSRDINMAPPANTQTHGRPEQMTTMENRERNLGRPARLSLGVVVSSPLPPPALPETSPSSGGRTPLPSEEGQPVTMTTEPWGLPLGSEPKGPSLRSPSPAASLQTSLQQVFHFLWFLFSPHEHYHFVQFIPK